MPDLYEVMTHALAHGWTPEEAEMDLVDVQRFVDSLEGDE